MVTEYVPLAAVVAFAMDGLCKAEVKPFGPVHAYVAPVTAAVLRLIVAPAQIVGVEVVGVGVAGIGLTVTLTVPGKLLQPSLLIITIEYVPLAAAVAFGMLVVR
jgi:hypothetical protein